MMLERYRWAPRAGIPLLVLGVGCSHVGFDPDDLERIGRVAVVAYVERGPTIKMPGERLAEVREALGGGPEDKLRQAFAKKIVEAVNHVELAEFIRADFAGLLDLIKEVEVVPPVEVATAMSSYLVESRDYQKLLAIRVDAVFEITVSDYGISYYEDGDDQRTGYHVDITARLLDLKEDGDVIWQRRAAHDGAESGKYPASLMELALNPADTFRAGFGALIERSSQVLFADLGIVSEK